MTLLKSASVASVDVHQNCSTLYRVIRLDDRKDKLDAGSMSVKLRTEISTVGSDASSVPLLGPTSLTLKLKGNSSHCVCTYACVHRGLAQVFA